MYLKIEDEFKRKSSFRHSKLAHVIFQIALYIASIYFVYTRTSFNECLWVLLYPVILDVLTYIFIIFRICKMDEFSWRNVLDSDINKDIYQMMIHKKDINILKEILYKNKIDTKPKIVETLRHYQTLLPRLVEGGGTFLSVLAVAASILALLLNDSIFNNDTNLKGVLAIFLFISMCYIAYNHVSKNFIRTFGKVELYKRLEASISEIYMNLEESPTKDEISKVKSKNRTCKHKKIKSYGVNIKINHK